MNLLSSWSWDPSVLLGLALAAWLYVRGLHQIWKRAGLGRGVRTWQAQAFAAGLAVLFVALLSPLDALSAALFSAHMVQHLLLMLVAAPLLVLGDPLVAILWALPRGWRSASGGVGSWPRKSPLRQVRRLLRRPFSVWLLLTAALWTWHVPALFDLALRNGAVHVLEHLCFLGTSLLFWQTVLGPSLRHRSGFGVRIALTFAAALQSTILGIVLTFAGGPLYVAYGGQAALWHLTPVEDQQLAGLIMWIPAGLVYLLAILLLFWLWFQAAERVGQTPETQTRRRSPEATPAIPAAVARRAGGRSARAHEGTRR